VATTTQPVMSKERFQSTPTFAQYVPSMTANKEKMQQHLNEVEVPPEDLEWWRRQGPINVYVLTYDSCGDALYNLPILGKIAQQCPNIDLRVAQRDQNLDLMDRYLNQGIYRSVPTFIFMDENMNEIGNLKERAESMSRVMEQEQLNIRRRLREENKGPWRQEMLDEFKNVVQQKKRYP
jgi:hypothetical protein